MARHEDVDGTICMTRDELQEVLTSAARDGARQALADLGLQADDDKDRDNIRTDMHDLRSFIKAMRFARRTAFRAVVEKVVDLIIMGGVLLLFARYGFKIGGAD